MELRIAPKSHTSLPRNAPFPPRGVAPASKLCRSPGSDQWRFFKISDNLREQGNRPRLPLLRYLPPGGHTGGQSRVMTIRDTIPGPDDASVSVATYRRIRADIVFGRAAPGRKLGLEEMRDTYCVSISTLRELLGRLCSENLVVAEGQKGFRVAPISAEDFRE